MSARPIVESDVTFHVRIALNGVSETPEIECPHAKLRMFAAYLEGATGSSEDAAKLREIIDASHALPSPQ